METASNTEFQIVFSEATQDSIIQCHLSPKTSAVNMEIRWFKETDCVCFYKNGRLIEGESYEGISLCTDKLERGIVSLQLKDVGKPYVGDYLCQITSGNKTAEITIALKTHEDQTEMPRQTIKQWTKQINREWTDKERINMANSALLAVFCSLEKTDAAKSIATMLQTDVDVEENQNKTEKKDTQQDYMHRHVNDSMSFQVIEMEASTCKLEEQETTFSNNLKTKDFTNPGQELEILPKSNKNEGQSQQVKIKRQKIGNDKPSSKEVKVFPILAGKTNDCHKEFIATLKNQIENLKEGRSVDESDIILVFCPIVSRAGTDIDAALKKSSYSTDSKLTVLVVLHYTFDPEKTVPESSKYVNRANIIIVDCLFNEDAGLVKCQKNSDSTDKAVNWLIQQGTKMGITISPCQYKPYSPFNVFSLWTQLWKSGHPKEKSEVPEMTCNSSHPVNYFIHSTGDTCKCDVDFIAAVHKLVNLRKVSKVQDSDITLIFCPVFSQSDISSALQEYHKIQDKPVVVIFLHKTPDSNSVPNSSGYVKKHENILVVDCIYCDGEGLPDCEKNRDAISEVKSWIKAKFREH